MDAQGRTWFPLRSSRSPGGLTVVESSADAVFVSVVTPADGLPIHPDHFTCAAASPDGSVWFGSSRGVVRFDGEHWAYRQGKRWLPDDDVRAIAIDPKGGGWIATAGGLAHIHFKPMTLKEKAVFSKRKLSCTTAAPNSVSSSKVTPNDRVTNPA